tara:strand:+ start:3306 stop:4409 length:1104 start_codon:yes stop_codon:yes gene_type:complete
MPIDFKTFDSIINNVVDPDTENYSVMIRGRHGIGKSQVVYQYAEKFGLQVVERRISQMTEGDILGLPKMEEETTTWNPPDWFKDCCDNPRLLFLDEVDRGTHEVRQSIFELGDSRKLNGWHLHPGTIIFSAVNGGEHAAHYQVGEMDPAALDRWVVFDVEPTVEDWLSWAKAKVAPVVWDFINNNRGHLEHTDDFEPNKVYPSRRSWDRLSQIIGRNGAMNSPKSNLAMIRDLSCGFVGLEAALAFADFVSNYEEVVTVEDIVDLGRDSLTADWDINQHTAMVDSIENSPYVAQVLSPEQVANLANYFARLPSEVAMRLWYSLGKSTEEDSGVSKKNSHNFHNAETSSGVMVKTIMVELLSGVSISD